MTKILVSNLLSGYWTDFSCICDVAWNDWSHC